MTDSCYSEFDLLTKRYQETHEVIHLQSAFRLLDLNRDGFISKEELLSYYKSREVLEDAKFITDALFRVGDMNKDGVLDEKEFVTMVATALSHEVGLENSPDVTLSPADLEIERLLVDYCESRNPSNLESIFSMIDTNQDRVITKAELQASYLIRGTKDEGTAASVMMAMGDLNQDGVLSLEEFKILMEGTFE